MEKIECQRDGCFGPCETHDDLSGETMFWLNPPSPSNWAKVAMADHTAFPYKFYFDKVSVEKPKLYSWVAWPA